ncbi:MAG TPA: metabolite traffic protein EboE [Xanthobacteraceae bacterium]|jgi:sugar phosphate isomerase/epimerase|nr:metabolite traffic protein EboE [Xanthobacteraceae bacterium]
MDLGNGLGHLTYSTLVHPADDWEQLYHSLVTYLPKVKARVASNQPFGVCIRLAAKTAETLAKSQTERDKLKKFLDANDMYIYTANAFVYGHFKGDKVKEQVYEPDWRGEERTQYTINVAEVLADVCPKGIAPSIQTAPLGFKPRVTGSDIVASYTDHVLRVVAHLIELESRTGCAVQLALEPEPFCFLETTDETVAYFRDHVYSGAATEKLAKLAHIPITEATEALRRHLGIVYDICHQAVEYEDIYASLQKLVDAGIPVFKLQEAAALYVPEVTQSAVDTLKRYAKTIYLTQTLEKKDGKITKYLNVDDAIAEFEKNPGPREWRTHIHVPIFLDDLGQFRTTRFAIEDALRFHKEKPLSRQLEIETYTWDMLPDSLKTGDIVDYVCREIEWVKNQLV